MEQQPKRHYQNRITPQRRSWLGACTTTRMALQGWGLRLRVFRVWGVYATEPREVGGHLGRILFMYLILMTGLAPNPSPILNQKPCVLNPQTREDPRPLWRCGSAKESVGTRAPDSGIVFFLLGLVAFGL